MLNVADINKIVSIAEHAGEKILEVYKSADFGVERKADESPLTRADKLSNEVILEGLSKISSYSIVTEEDEASHHVQAETFWLIDPLDGTKEFIKKNDEFTVNIGLIHQGQPVFGVVGAPALRKIYWTSENGKALKKDGTGTQIIKAEQSPDEPVAVVSRSHLDDQTKTVLENLGIKKTTPSGSSLKFCLVAEGSAHLYPRLAPTMIWDTAAADAVVRAAGGIVVNNKTKESLHYSTDQLTNPFFICTSLGKKMLARL